MAIILARTLNYLRREYPASYVGLRSILSSMPADAVEKWVYNVSRRKRISQRQNIYRTYPTLKKASLDGSFEYRDFIAPGPATAIFEATLLQELERIGDFWGGGCVYSYKRPKGHDVVHMFDPYMKGYQGREADVRMCLGTNRAFVAQILDIRSFYPSINRAELMAEVRETLNRHSVDAALSKRFHWAVETLFSASGETSEVGIPIGSPLSHLLGNIALRKLDLAFGDSRRYFRYVDDLIFIGTKEECADFKSKATDIIGKMNLTFNDDKGDLISTHEFDESRKWAENAIVTGGFAELVSRIALLYQRNPSHIDSLYLELLEDGIVIPHTRVEHLARYPRFNRWISIIRKIGERSAFRNISLSFLLLSDSASVIKKDIIALRDALLEEAYSIKNCDIPSRGMKRRWFVQRCRCVFNRLIYLCAPEKFSSCIPEIEELAELRATVSFLFSGDANALRGFPGAPSRVGGEVFSRLNKRVKAFQPDSAQDIETLMALKLWGILDGADFDNVPVLRAIGRVDGKRTLRDFSYGDEIECLLNGWASDQVRRFLLERFNHDEVPLFEGSRLDGGYSG